MAAVVASQSAVARLRAWIRNLFRSSTPAPGHGHSDKAPRSDSPSPQVERQHEANQGRSIATPVSPNEPATLDFAARSAVARRQLTAAQSALYIAVEAGEVSATDSNHRLWKEFHRASDQYTEARDAERRAESEASAPRPAFLMNEGRNHNDQ